MKPSIERLSKFLRLEAERGYDDRAVFGGLRSILESWENDARAEEVPNIVIQAVTARLRDYHQLTPASREEILRGLWRRLQRSSQEPLPDLFEAAPAGPTPDVPTPDVPKSDSEPVPNRKAPERIRPAPQAHIEDADADLAAPEPESPDDSGRENALPDLEDVPEEEAQRAVRRMTARKYSIPPVVSVEEAAALDAPLTVISGIGPKSAERLEQLNMRSLGDALYFFPRRYDDYSRLEPINRLMFGQAVTVIGAVERVQLRPTRSGQKIVEALISDGSGAIRATWFNQPWLVDQLREAENVSLSGKIDQYLGRLVMNSPEWEALENRNLHTHRIVPVYPLTGQISQKWLRAKIKEIVDYWAPRVQEPLPAEMLESAGLMPISAALRQIHYPDTWEDLEAARHRLAFDEIFTLQLGVLQQRRIWTEREGARFETPQEWLDPRLARLPYDLTGAQQKAIADLRSDLAAGRPMNRLLQGDVGSGKTVVAALAIEMVTRADAQAALMAPTGILAEQHFSEMKALLASAGGTLQEQEIALLVGATPESEKQAIRAGLAKGQIRLVIGTHALIEPDVLFKRLELVVIDEQHRFGVRQRAALRDKGDSPHLLVMTATPIPRSLALTVYGDLDISVMDELPPGRQPVGTYLLRPIERERAYSLVSREVEKGRQAFMIYPLVEESESSEARAAVEEHQRLSEKVFHNLRLGLVHGRMSGDEKEAAMSEFRSGETQILVSTSVVEVGVDVPNATVMVIEGANRFGLAQLHQFRGRVGRGSDKSFCLLIPDQDDAVENERLKAMTETNDGFVLAEKDLEQRGPGEFLGTRQSGYASLQLASITDTRLIEKAREHAQGLFAVDPDLSDPAHAALARQIRQIFPAEEGDIS